MTPSLRPVTRVSPIEADWKAKFITTFPPRKGDQYEYHLHISDGTYWYEKAFFTENDIPSVIAAGILDEYPKIKAKMIATMELKKGVSCEQEA